MTERALHFLEIPTRGGKPRQSGFTLARDYGIGFHEAEDWMESVGGFIDYVKMRHVFTLTASLDPADLMLRKIKLYTENQVEVNPGGIVYELAFLQGQVDHTFETLRQMGFTAVECSENIVPLTLEDKVAAVRSAKKNGLKVLFEVGEKYPDGPIDVEMASRDITTLLAQDCDLVIIERSLIEQSLGVKGEKKEAARLEELARNVPVDKIVWEAEAIPHQAWLIKTFGADVNLGPNLEPNYIAKLEATRLSFSREGGYTWLAGKIKG